MVYTGWLTSQSLITAAHTTSLWLVCNADTEALANEHQRACPSTSNEDRWRKYHIITGTGTWVWTVEARKLWKRRWHYLKDFFFIYKNSAVILQGENKPHGHLKIKFKSIFIILLHIQCVQHHSHGSVKDYAKRSQRSSIIDSQS